MGGGLGLHVLRTRRFIIAAEQTVSLSSPITNGTPRFSKEAVGRDTAKAWRAQTSISRHGHGGGLMLIAMEIGARSRLRPRQALESGLGFFVLCTR